MTTDRVADHLSKLVHGVSLREDGMAESVSFVAALGRLLNSEDDLRVPSSGVIISMLKM
jgi:hypothetical protein